MKQKILLSLMSLFMVINLWAVIPTDISKYSSQGISHVYSNDDQFDIKVSYLAYQDGMSDRPMNCVKFYSPSGLEFVLNASNLFDSSVSQNNSQFISYMTQKDRYTFIDLQSKESGVWHLKLVQQYAGNWMYYYSSEYDKPIVSVATISQDCSKNGIQAVLSGTNGHEYVDLGLSVYWATCNVGATTPEGYGDYFAWGETSPKTTYSWSNYKYSNSTGSVMTKYNSTDGKTTLDIEDDAAHVNWGGSWRMPTNEELAELFSCSLSNQSISNIKGFQFVNNGNSIFIPKAGAYYDETSIWDLQSHVDIWSASLCTNISTAVLYGGDAGDQDRYEGERYQGRSIRPVCPKNITPSGEQVTLTLLASGCSTSSIYTCSKGQQVSIKAEPQENSEFSRWSDGNTDNPRTIIVSSNMTLIAEFSSTTPTETLVSVYDDCSKNGYTKVIEPVDTTKLPIMGTATVSSSAGRTSCDYVQLWENGPKWATFNVGATITDYAQLTVGADPTSFYNYTEQAPYYNTANVGGLYAWNNPNLNGRKTTWDGSVSTGISDVATTLWGSNWKTPTKAQLDTLQNSSYGKTTWIWCDGSTTQYVAGCTLKGYKVSGVGNYAKYSIFLPAAGYFGYDLGAIGNASDYGDYWSSTENDSLGAYYLYFGSYNRDIYGSSRKYGLSVRAVLAL